MSQFQQFIFESYQFTPEDRTLRLKYALDDAYHFTETFRFNFDYVDYSPEALDRALQLLFFVAGVSYYKKFLPPQIVVKQGDIDTPTAQFLGKTYQKGLGELFYVNQLDPNTPVAFPATMQSKQPVTVHGEGKLIGLGGGKDSLVTVELLRQADQNLATWSLNHQSQLTPLVERVGLPHYWVEREWDPQLAQLKGKSYSGHVPISAIFACVGAVVCILSGKRDNVVSNEQSANEPTLHYQGVDINHQYSKSQEFEQDFQQILAHNFGDSLRYYSFLRPYSEVRIGELFATIGFEKYKDVFSSCNRAFIHTSDRMSWCGECSKCAFVYMVLAPFIKEDDLNALWHGKNLLKDPALETTYRNLLGIEGDKPLDCVGEVKESREAMHLSQSIYPKLREKYQFELPEDYSYRTLGSDQMPADVKELFAKVTAPFEQNDGQRG
ncbi:MAG TPA: hypothetical protein VFT16_05850 [Candidatus Saccharimonadales bacterium]|nr:hypothetical protein [Candidatus Saccharimonadales bacterium]